MATYELVSSDRSYVVMPLFHVHGLMAGLLAPLAASASVILPAGGKFSAAVFWTDCVAHGVTFYTAVPTMHQVRTAGTFMIAPSIWFTCNATPKTHSIQLIFCYKTTDADSPGQPVKCKSRWCLSDSYHSTCISLKYIENKYFIVPAFNHTSSNDCCCLFGCTIWNVSFCSTPGTATAHKCGIGAATCCTDFKTCVLRTINNCVM